METSSVDLSIIVFAGDRKGVGMGGGGGVGSELPDKTTEVSANKIYCKYEQEASNWRYNYLIVFDDGFVANWSSPGFD